MAYKDLREFIEVLERNGEILRIPVSVDWMYEVAGWIRKSVDVRPKKSLRYFSEILKGILLGADYLYTAPFMFSHAYRTW